LQIDARERIEQERRKKGSKGRKGESLND